MTSSSECLYRFGDTILAVAEGRVTSTFYTETQCNHVMIAIDPRHVENIRSGRKTVEFRKGFSLFGRPNVLWIYATRPVDQVVAIATVLHHDVDTPKRIWERHELAGCITKEEFNVYFRGCKEAGALILLDVHDLVYPLSAKVVLKAAGQDTIPQSFGRLDRATAQAFMKTSLTSSRV